MIRKAPDQADRPERGCLRRIAASAFAFTAGAALAGPPYQTDDPEPVDYRHYEVYVASQMTRTASGKSGTLPHLEFNYGAAPDVHVHLLAPYVFSTPAGAATERGYGDTELGVKYRVVHESDTHPMVGVFPILLSPTGDSDKGLGNGGSQLFLPIWLQKKLGNGWQTYGGGGYWIVHGLADQNYWFAGWQIQKELSERLTLGAEVFHRTEQLAGQGASSGFNLGGNYNVDEHNHLLFSFGKGIQNVDQTNRFSAYLAYQWTY